MTATPQNTTIYDYAVVGAGIVGSAIARDLAGTSSSVALIEARNDVGDGTSKANTAILHTGFDAKPGTLEARLVARGYELLGQYATEAGIPVERTGALLVAWSPEELAELPKLQAKAAANGYAQTQIVDADEVYHQVPALAPGALGGLTVPGESIICTWTTNLALATDAVTRGARLHLDRRVTGVEVGQDHTTLHTETGDIHAKWVINAAGLGGDHLDRAFGFDRFQLHPRRGELFVFDKLARPLVDRIVLPVPTTMGKGVLVSPTIYGNVMLGPTSEDMTDRTATGTTEAGFEFLLSKGERLMPQLLTEEVSATYAGLRAASSYPDFLIELDEHQRYVVAGGIRSTGLTAGMAISEYIIELLAKAGNPVAVRGDLPSAPHMPNLGENTTRPYQDADAIAADPAYGTIVCFCERVTEGEIRDACTSLIPPGDLGGLSRRTRATNGRCQGFYCAAAVAALAERHGCCRTQPSAVGGRSHA